MPSQATLDAAGTHPASIADFSGSDPADANLATVDPATIILPHHESLLQSAATTGCAAASWHTNTQVLQRRRWHRIPYTDPILVAQYDAQSDKAFGPLTLVTGRDISLGGVSFSHTQPLSCRRIVCIFVDEGRVMSSVLVRLNWCRFTKQGVYLSGGQFLRPVAIDVAGVFDLSQLPAG